MVLTATIRERLAHRIQAQLPSVCDIYAVTVQTTETGGAVRTAPALRWHGPCAVTEQRAIVSTPAAPLTRLDAGTYWITLPANTPVSVGNEIHVGDVVYEVVRRAERPHAPTVMVECARK